MTNSKRSFSVDTTSLSTSAPLLDNGFYSGELTGASIQNKDHEDFIKVQEEKKWDKVTKEMVLTGDYVISGMLMYSVTLNSKKAIKELQKDEPRLFGSPIFLRFDKKTYSFLDNPQIGQLLKVFDLADTNLEDLIDFEEDETIEVPTELANVPDIVNMLNAVEYHKAWLTLLCQSIDGLPCKAKIVKQASRGNADVQENTLDMGTRGALFCGVLPPEEGFENDLED